MRILFATDLHGSTLVFRKALMTARNYDVDLFILGGDVSGKRMLPIVPMNDGRVLIYEPYKMRDETGGAVEVAQEREVMSENLHSAEQRLEGKGYYYEVCSEAEIDDLNASPTRLRALFFEHMRDRLLQWSRMASEIFPTGDCWWTGGNDDEEEVLAEVAAQAPSSFRYVEDKVVDLAGFKLASMGYSNVTPFHTSRELSEEALAERLRQITSELSGSDQVILNVHVPPFGCGTLDVVASREPGVSEHVGSHAVRSFIQSTEPVAALVGHIHEGKGVAQLGRTEVFNPGSDYTAGVLNAFVLSINPLRGRSEFVHVRV